MVPEIDPNKPEAETSPEKKAPKTGALGSDMGSTKTVDTSSAPDGIEKKTQKNQFERRTALAIGLFIGIILATMFVLFGLEYFMENVANVAVALLIGIFAVCVFALLAYWFRDQIFKRFFATPRANIGEAVEALNDVVQKVSQADFKGSSEAGIKALQVVAAWYSWITLRRLFVTIVLSLVVAFGGILGSVYLYQQNDLIKSQSLLTQAQNQLIEKENFLLESDRRAALLSELSNVFNEIDEELDEVEAKNLPRLLSARLTSRIVALSKSLKPYRYLDTNGELIPRPVSPERAQLFLTIIELNLDNLGEILQNGNFRYADLPETPLSQKDFSGLDLSQSSFRSAELSGMRFSSTQLIKADFTQARMTEVDFSYAEMDSVIFDQASIQASANFLGVIAPGSRFRNSRLVGVDFRGADLSGADFSGADARGIELLMGGAPMVMSNQFRGASLRGASFVNAKLNNADFRGADLRRADFTDADLVDIQLSPETFVDSTFFLRTRIGLGQLADLAQLGIDTTNLNRKFLVVTK